MVGATKELPVTDFNAEIYLYIDVDGPGVIRVYPSPEGDYVVNIPKCIRGTDFHFRTMNAATIWAMNEAQRLQKLGYTNVDWGSNAP